MHLDAVAGQERGGRLVIALLQILVEDHPHRDTRGGAILSVLASTGVPVRFIGVGEQVDALDTFYPDRMAQRIIGMGDIMGIIERAELVIDRDEAEGSENKMASGNLDLSGSFGVFFPGELKAYLYNEGGLETSEVSLQAVHPQEPVTLRQSIEAAKNIARVSIHLIDGNGVDRGALGEVFVTINEEGH